MPKFNPFHKVNAAYGAPMGRQAGAGNLKHGNPCTSHQLRVTVTMTKAVPIGVPQMKALCGQCITMMDHSFGMSGPTQTGNPGKRL